MYYQLKILRPVFAEIARNKQTTGLGHITAKDMKNMYVFRPEKNLLDSFNQYVTPLFDKWYTNLMACKALTILRDTLLPKLLSGKLRIPDAEKLAAEAA